MKGVYIYHSDSKEELSKDSVGVLKKIFSKTDYSLFNFNKEFLFGCKPH